LTVEIGVVVVLILLNGFFAMAELAIVSARRSKLRQMAEAPHAGAALALKLAEDPASFLSIVQIGMTLNSVLAGAFSGATLAEEFGHYLSELSWMGSYGEPVAMVTTVAGVTYLNLVFGELLPKRIGLAYAEPIAVNVAFAMKFFSAMAGPVVWILRQSTELSLRLLRLTDKRDNAVTEQEVKDMIAEGTASGIFHPTERSMLEGVMRLADRTVRTIMTPRVDMVWLSIDDPPREHKAILRSSGYSRLPVARGDLEEILGIVYAKDLLNASFDGHTLSLMTLMRPALVVPDSTTVMRLLDQFKQSGQHVAIVVDEYGSVEGLVSATDILETITGELPELGQDSPAQSVQREDGSWLLDGWMPIDEVEALTGLKNLRGEGDFHTLAGFVIDRLGRIPATGDYFHQGAVRFEVMDMDSRRVDKVLVMAVGEEVVADD
jgi:putative hemolysin